MLYQTYLTSVSRHSAGPNALTAHFNLCTRTQTRCSSKGNLAMSSKARKRRQKQKAVDSQKKLKLELKECQSSL